MSSVDPPKNKSLKCVLVGPNQSGKTAFTIQLVDKTFDPEYTNRISASFLKYKHTNDHYLELWDISAHQRYIPSSPMYYLRGANFVLLFVNPTSNGTNDWRVDFGLFFKAISSQISTLYHDCESKDIPRFAFVCTHSDQPYVDIDHLEDFHTELTKIVKHIVPIFHISSLNGQGFNDVTDHIFDSPKEKSHIMDSHVEVDNEEKEEKDEGKFCTIL
jgi:GTPase SAR1 family protein